MLSLRTHAIICGALFASLIGIAILGNMLERAGMSPPTGAARVVALACYFALFVTFGLSTIPVIVKLVLAGQPYASTQNVALVAMEARRQKTIIWTLWGLMVAGLVVAVPAAVFGGMFGDGPRHALDRAFRGANLGTLAAKPDMTLDEMVAQSTIKLELRYARSAIAGGRDGVFDYVIPGTTLTFPGARYYYITTYSNDPKRVEVVNIGTSPEKMTLTALDSADVALRARLASDGWLAGHEVYRSAESRTLHGGLSEGPEGRHWIKDGIVLTINRKRMDDAVAGEDTTTAGEWIQHIDLWPSKTFPGFERFVFQRPR
ncbi:MAG: hypothetical protein ABJE10_14445 [bacterium]